MPQPADPRLEARAEVFKALGHPTRLSIVGMLSGGEMSVQDIAAGIDADLSTVSRHLAVLRRVGILAARKRGNQVFHALACPCVTTFQACLDGVIDGAARAVILEAKR